MWWFFFQIFLIPAACWMGLPALVLFGNKENPLLPQKLQHFSFFRCCFTFFPRFSGISALWNSERSKASETNHIPSFPSHSQPGWQANAWLFWCKASGVDGQAVWWRIEGSFSRPTVPIQHTRKDTSNPVWAFNKSWTSGQQRPQKCSTKSLCQKSPQHSSVKIQIENLDACSSFYQASF